MLNKKRLAGGLLAIAAPVFLAGGALAQNGDLPEITMIGDSGEVPELMGQAVQEMIRQATGYEINLEVMDFQTRLQRMDEGNYDIVFAGWGPDYNDPQTFLDLFVTDGSFNDGGYSNAEYDRAIEIAATSTDQEERMQALAEAERILAEDPAVAPVYWRYIPYRARDYVHGIVLSAVGARNEWKWAYTDGRPEGDDLQYLNLNLADEPPDLDPQETTDSISFDILNATLEGLVRRNAEGTIEKGSGLAEDWDVSADETVYTFYLRDAEWMDGTPVTADDFVYAWRRAVDPRTASQYQFMMEYLENGSDIARMDPDDPNLDAALTTLGVEAVDAKTLRVTLENPSAIWLGLTAFITYLPAPKHMVEELGDDYAAEANLLGASGPFYVARWDHDYQLVLEKNPNYWDADTVQLERIHFDMIEDQGTSQNLYDTGLLDRTSVQGAYIDIYRGELSEPVSDGASFYLQFNIEGNPFLANPKIRQAMSLSINRKAFAEQVLRNGSQPATSLVPPIIPDPVRGGPFSDRAGVLIPPEGDPELAKQLWEEGLAEMGY